MPAKSQDFTRANSPSIPSGIVGTVGQGAYSTVSNTVAGAVTIGALTLLSDVIAAIPTLQDGINHNRALLNYVIDALQAKGILA